MKRRSYFWLATGLGLAALIILAGSLAGCGRTESRAGITWLTDFDAALQQAQATNQLVVIDFFATWCGPCKMMERNTFTDERVRQRMAGFIPLKIDVDRQPQLAARYGIEAMPTTVVVNASGQPVARSVGYLNAKDFLAVLDAAKPGASGTGSTK